MTTPNPTDFKHLKRSPLRLAIALTATSLLVAGCGGSSSSDDDHDDHHDHTEIESEGRLVTFDGDAGQLRVIELDDGTQLESFALDGAAPYLHASPGKRYAVVIQRADDRVSFLDSGLYVEDHGDHMHEYADSPALESLTLNDHRPTHYTYNDDTGVVFFDGSDGTASSRVTLFTEQSLASGSAVASLDRDNNMHGVAKLIGDQLFVTYRDPAITETTLPAAVQRYSFDGESFTFETQYDEPCPLLHGAGANDHALAFGCSDGLLVIDLHGDDYAASKLANPASLAEGSRIGHLAAHHSVEAMVGGAGDRLFVVDAESADSPYQELVLGEGVAPVAEGFDAHGERFYVLGDDGQLRLFDPANAWALAKTVTVTAPLAEDAASPEVTPASGHDLLVLDPATNTITTVDSHEGEIEGTLELDFNASGLVWLGLMDDDHSHDHDDHDHDSEEHDHDDEDHDH